MSAPEVVAELEGLARSVRAVSDEGMTASSACLGWSVGDVIAHVSAAMDAQQAAFANMLSGSADTPPFSNVEYQTPSQVRTLFDNALSVALDTYGKVSDADTGRPVPLPFGTFPSETALDIVLLEYGTHRYDIEVATNPTVELSLATADAVLRLLPGFVAVFAVRPAPESLAYRLDAPGARVDVSAREGDWVLEPGDVDATTVIAGRDAPVALFALGRVGADDRRLSVTGPDADAFKTWFPGP